MTVTAREKILDAADRLFSQVGYDAASTREIADLCGVNKALIHYHFKNKEAVLQQLLERYYAGLTDSLTAALQTEGDLRTRMAALLDAYCNFLEHNRNFVRIVQREVVSGALSHLIHEHTVPVFEVGRRLIEEAAPQTRGGPLDAVQLLVSFYSMIIGYFNYIPVLQPFLDDDPASPEAFAARRAHLRRMLELTLDAVGV